MTDAEGTAFGVIDFRVPEAIEVVLVGGHAVRIAKAHFEGQAAGASLRLKTAADAVFVGRQVTTIDGIDLGRAVAVAHSDAGSFEALVVDAGSEAGLLAVPFASVREVAAHIILEPSAQEVRDDQPSVLALPSVAATVERARAERSHQR